VKWWYIPVILLDAYLILSLVPWIALQVLEWLLRRPGRALDIGGPRLHALTEAERAQAALWPSEPRPGRYQGADMAARDALTTLRAALAEAERLWPTLAVHAPVGQHLADVVLLRSWGPLLNVIVATRDAAALQRALGQGEQALAVLQDQRTFVEDVPSRVRGTLNDTRADIRRLTAQMEAEQEVGTVGLDKMEQRLQRAEQEVERALDALSQANPQTLPQVVYDIDELLKLLVPAVEEMDRTLSQAVEERNKAQTLVTRTQSNLQLVAERWEALQARGATEPAIARGLAELRLTAEQLQQIVKLRTLDAYQQAGTEVEQLDGQIAALTGKLDALDEIMQRSRQVVEGDVQALTQAQTVCNTLVSQDPLLEPDQSLTLIEKAGEAYMEAERQRGLGTIQGYETALRLSETAGRYLAEAQEVGTALPEQAQQARALLATLSADLLGEWRTRAGRVREQLQTYPRHWEGKLAGDTGEAFANLDQAEVDLERVSPNVRYQRRLRQSELTEAISILEHGRGCMEKAQEAITQLEAEAERIAKLQNSLMDALHRLTQQTLPVLRGLNKSMLPESQQRLTELQQNLRERMLLYGDPAKINYDEAAGEWLPSFMRQVEELHLAHENSIRHYQELMREAFSRIDRQWARLNRLNPLDPPGPAEDVNRLAADLEAWRTEAEKQEDNPLALQELLGRSTAALEQRIEVAQRQITEGRRALEGLDRQYAKHAQAVRDLQTRILTIQRENHWPKLVWDTLEAEHAWQKTQELERVGRAAVGLVTACDQVQQAVNAAQQAEQLYARVERQMDSAVRRLDDEYRAVVNGQRRIQSRAEALRARDSSPEGSSEELAALDELNASVERALQMAEATATFEDALRYLRDARALLGRG
jgi:hypothetical protein